MDYQTHSYLHSPQESVDSKSSRMSIEALLNPSAKPASPTPYSPPAYDYDYQKQHYQPYVDYQQPQYQSLPYRPPNGQSHYDEHQESERRRRSGSANSSPGPYRRERFPSVSSGSSTINERRRPPRPKYDEEEMYFIWYHRVDLRQEWKEVRESFNAQFPDRQRSGFQGIQCKYYRFIKEKNCPTLREQKRRRNANGGSDSGSEGRSREDLPAYGVVRWTGMRFPWMKDSA